MSDDRNTIRAQAEQIATLQSVVANLLILLQNESSTSSELLKELDDLYTKHEMYNWREES